MGTLRSEQVFEQVARDLQRLYDVQAARWLCDAHPGYTTSRWVQASGQRHETVLHHHAHASAIVTEHGVDDPAWCSPGTGLATARTAPCGAARRSWAAPVAGNAVPACAASACRR